METIGGNAGRGGHSLALGAARVVYRAREAVAKLLGASDPMRIVFTASATEALNLALKGLLRPGDHVVTTSMEHNSVIRPLRTLEARGVTFDAVAASPTGSISIDDLEAAIGPETRLVVISHASNVTGAIAPLTEIAEACRRRRVKLLVDAAQTAGVYPIDVEALSVDLLAFAGHKGLFGPPGTGGLYLGLGVSLEPLIHGGTGSASDDELQPTFLPDRYESGTLNTVGLAGLAAGAEFVLEEGITSIREKEEALANRIRHGLGLIRGVKVYGPPETEPAAGVVSFSVTNGDPGDVAFVLDRAYGIAVRAGLHCAPRAHRTIGTFPQGTIRVSPGYFNEEDDVSKFLAAISEIASEGF
jgi:cysteine desulfurase family protein